MSGDVTVLAIMQNQWFKDPKRWEDLHAKWPERRQELIARALWMGCKTGRVLQQILGEEWCERIIWEEASMRIGPRSYSAFPPDIDHIRNIIARFNPGFLVTFGKVAEKGVKIVRANCPIHHAPHPAARHTSVLSEIQTVRRLLDNLTTPTSGDSKV